MQVLSGWDHTDVEYKAVRVLLGCIVFDSAAAIAGPEC